MRIRIKQLRPGNINEAIKLAVELEAYNRVEHKSHLQVTLTEADTNSLSAISKITEKFDKLQKDVDEMKGPRHRHGLRTSTGTQISGDTAKRKTKSVSTAISLIIYVETVFC
jgi:hypothetical protein